VLFLDDEMNPRRDFIEEKRNQTIVASQWTRTNLPQPNLTSPNRPQAMLCYDERRKSVNEIQGNQDRLGWGLLMPQSIFRQEAKDQLVGSLALLKHPPAQAALKLESTFFQHPCRGGVPAVDARLYPVGM
jgi:hypothetical protein